MALFRFILTFSCIEILSELKCFFRVFQTIFFKLAVFFTRIPDCQNVQYIAIYQQLHAESRALMVSSLMSEIQSDQARAEIII